MEVREIQSSATCSGGNGSTVAPLASKTTRTILSKNAAVSGVSTLERLMSRPLHGGEAKGGLNVQALCIRFVPVIKQGSLTDLVIGSVDMDCGSHCVAVALLRACEGVEHLDRRLEDGSATREKHAIVI